ncbi:uncharacterized protein DUF1016 [Pasteurella langaaensis DSM 22999]|uniref:Uncharacterized protein DUF1016 n=1 Tax=Alitibacter langaaensis DSM 22999 TaxID=1122935 RepID=A0A2U0SL98_9PAST|nr:DUF1016 N-terminal domain-containing protein [Pasteurella langaaensis]PVX32125.1 uncharacterized protein DUF1016 [Pasteurella langaaensis DSM 22999]
MVAEKHLVITEQQLVSEISQLIQSSKQRVAVAVNAELTLLYWHIGQRINQHILQNERAEYGKQVIKNLSKSLTEQFGKGWGRSHLNYCVKFADTFGDLEIVHALRGKLSWTYFTKLFVIDDPKVNGYVSF